MTNGSLMKVESIAEAFCNTFDLHLTIFCLENQFLIFFRVAVLERVFCTLKFGYGCYRCLCLVGVYRLFFH